MSTLTDFYGKHRGETCLVIGLGPNLHLTPPALFSYPSFGINTFYKYEYHKPTYFVGVDERLKLEDGKAIVEQYADIPKFFPAPDWNDLQGKNIYRFVHRPGSQYVTGGQPITAKESLTRYGITYYRIMDAVFQIAAWMGFETILCIGIQHKPGTRRELFWGYDHGEPENAFEFEEAGYRYFSNALPCRILNISEDTYVPEDVLPRDDYRKWMKHDNA